MDLVLRLDGEELARVKLNSAQRFITEIELLRKQFKDHISAASGPPEFCIESMPSSINDFHPLGHHFTNPE